MWSFKSEHVLAVLLASTPWSYSLLMPQGAFTPAELAKFIALLAGAMVAITLVGFLLFSRWHRRDQARRARDLERVERWREGPRS